MGATTEALHRLIDIRCATKEDWELRRFSKVAVENEAVTARCVRWLLLDRSLTGYFQALGPMVILLVGGWAVMVNSISFETLAVVIAATSIMYGPVNALSAVPITLRQIEVAAENLLVLFEEKIEDDRERQGTGRSAFDTPISLISIRNLNYSYVGSQQRLSMPSLDIRDKTRVAVIGASGTGKSTLLRILFGLLNDYEGEIYFEGADIRTLSLRSLRQRIAYLPQDDILFGGSIKSNVAYGATDPDSVSEEEVLAALALAGVAGDVSSMPAGLDTHVELIGSNLSTGQRRRLSLARALMRRPDILLLDEPLAGVSPSEREAISRSLFSLSGLALVIVSHDYEILNGVDVAVRLRRLKGATDFVVADIIHRQTDSAGPLVFDEAIA
jgi:ABC-type bacteriocin/lantibiotic exporter with double-glycine peptidase domain